MKEVNKKTYSKDELVVILSLRRFDEEDKLELIDNSDKMNKYIDDIYYKYITKDNNIMKHLFDQEYYVKNDMAQRIYDSNGLLKVYLDDENRLIYNNVIEFLFQNKNNNVSITKSKSKVDKNITYTDNKYNFTINYNRNKDIVDSGHVTYQQIKRIKNWFDQYSGNKEDAPFKEELPVNPRLFYPLSKKLMEEVIQSYIKNYDMNITTLRFFNVFGPRQDIHRQSPPLLNYIVREIKQNRTPTFYSANGKPRDYIHVNDVVTLIEKCLNRTDRQIFNVCSGTLTSVKDIVGYAEKAFGKFDYIFKEPKMFWSEYPELYKGTNTIQDFVVENEVNKFSLGSTDKTRTLLDWNPNTDIESLMIDTMRINYERYSK